MIALVGDDGFRPVVWGIGATLAEAEEDAATVGNDCVPPLDVSTLVEHEITDEQAAIIRAGDVSWPVAAGRENG